MTLLLPWMIDRYPRCCSSFPIHPGAPVLGQRCRPYTTPFDRVRSREWIGKERTFPFTCTWLLVLTATFPWTGHEEIQLLLGKRHLQGVSLHASAHNSQEAA